MLGVLTVSQRIAPVMDAVLAQIKLDAAVFHIFMDVLKKENSPLADSIQQSFRK